MGSQIKIMSVVPIKLVHQISNKVISTYALQGNCSQGTFVMKRFLDMITIDGMLI